MQSGTPPCQTVASSWIGCVCLDEARRAARGAHHGHRTIICLVESPIPRIHIFPIHALLRPIHASNKDAQQRNKDPYILPSYISRRSEHTTTVHGDLPLHACFSPVTTEILLPRRVTRSSRWAYIAVSVSHGTVDSTHITYPPQSMVWENSYAVA